MSGEEILAIREEFRKVGWCPPNHKPKTTKNVAYAKSVWDRYVARCGHVYVRGVTVRESNRVSPGIVSTSVLMPINTLSGSGPADVEAWIN